jgi:glycine/D-amino acid oxidase-like deaminating enzyme
VTASPPSPPSPASLSVPRPAAASPEERRWRRLSLWWDGLPGPLEARPALDGDIDVDVAVVGAGFTGLWTAYYLLRSLPSARVALLEKDVAGAGASGRNGGWCSALFAASGPRIARQYGAPAARAMHQAMQQSVDEVGAITVAEGIDCHYAKGGTVVAARNRAQVQRAESEIADARALGIGEEDLRWLGRTEAARALGAEGILGATYTPHCAALDPARLARGLADVVVGLGARLYERTPVADISPGHGISPGQGAAERPRLSALGHSVRADIVVRAVEGWAPTLPGQRRHLLPVYSLMIATEPLPPAFWDATGLARRQTFSDGRHLVIYGQRTADGRLAFGGRGAPYHFASAVRASYDRVPAVHDALRGALAELFPSLRGVAVTHAWGGPLGVPRDWFSSVGLDRGPGMAWAGGYVGDGVSTSNLAGRTLADLVLRRDSDLVHLPWVGHRSPRWEPEPLRWLGVRTALWATKLADHQEERSGNTSILANSLGRLLGH